MPGAGVIEQINDLVRLAHAATNRGEKSGCQDGEFKACLSGGIKLSKSAGGLNDLIISHEHRH